MDQLDHTKGRVVTDTMWSVQLGDGAPYTHTINSGMLTQLLPKHCKAYPMTLVPLYSKSFFTFSPTSVSATRLLQAPRGLS